MASISFHVDVDSTDISIYVPKVEYCGCIGINITAYVDATKDYIHQKDSFTLHGTIEDIRTFAQNLLNALPASVPAPVTTDYEVQIANDIEEIRVGGVISGIV